MQIKGIETFYPANKKEWRDWLMENHRIKESVWLIYYKKHTNMRTLSWSEAVDEALCFGWIDSTARPIDNEKYMQFFSKRKPKSVWSKVNKEKVKRLMEHELMADAGIESIEIAKQNGSWTILDEVEELIIPHDLTQALNTYKGAMSFYMGLSKSIRKAILQWLVLAKKPETRKKRITEIAELAAKNMKPKQF